MLKLPKKITALVLFSPQLMCHACVKDQPANTQVKVTTHKQFIPEWIVLATDHDNQETGVGEVSESV